MTFRNVGIVESADIELGGLTILTGLNDTGKSFISKSIYGIIKTLRDSATQDMSEKVMQLDLLWIRIRDILNSEKNPEFLKLFEKLIIPMRNELYLEVSNKNPIGVTLTKLSNKEAEILKIEGLSENIKKGISQQFDVIATLAKTEKRDEVIRIKYFNSIIIQQLFKNQISNTFLSAPILTLRCVEGGAEILKISVVDNKTIEFMVDDSFITPSHFNDVVFIDSPIILQLNTLILKNRLDTSRPQSIVMPLYYPDLISKFIPVSNPVNKEIDKEIQEIIKGNVVYDVKSNKITYQKNDGKPIENYNIATGIKSFGALQLLLNAGSIHKNSMLIIDEPEVHLHPEWIIKYAKIIVELATADIPMVVSSHSPYLIEALSKFSKSIKSKTKFYWGEQNQNGMSVFNDVSENLEPIFKALADPMKKLSFYV